MAIRGPVGLLARPFLDSASIAEAALRFRRPFEEDIFGMLVDPNFRGSLMGFYFVLLGFLSFCLVHHRFGSWIGFSNSNLLALLNSSLQAIPNSMHIICFSRAVGVSLFPLGPRLARFKTCFAHIQCGQILRIKRRVDLKTIARSRDSEG